MRSVLCAAQELVAGLRFAQHRLSQAFDQSNDNAAAGGAAARGRTVGSVSRVSGGGRDAVYVDDDDESRSANDVDVDLTGVSYSPAPLSQKRR